MIQSIKPFCVDNPLPQCFQIAVIRTHVGTPISAKIKKISIGRDYTILNAAFCCVAKSSCKRSSFGNHKNGSKNHKTLLQTIETQEKKTKTVVKRTETLI